MIFELQACYLGSNNGIGTNNKTVSKIADREETKGLSPEEGGGFMQSFMLFFSPSCGMLARHKGKGWFSWSLAGNFLLLLLTSLAF